MLNIEGDFPIHEKLVPCRTDGRLLWSGFQAVVTLTLTLNRVIRHSVVHHSSTSIYNSTYQMSLKSEKKLRGRTNRRDPPLQVQSHVTQKLGQFGQISKIQPDKN